MKVRNQKFFKLSFSSFLPFLFVSETRGFLELWGENQNGKVKGREKVSAVKLVRYG